VTRRKTWLAVIAAAATIAATLASTFPAAAGAKDLDKQTTATPIEHLVVIFQENVSFDHYFATYPRATNPAGEPAFHATPHTPRSTVSPRRSWPTTPTPPTRCDWTDPRR
jgi:phospholipase C